jgi:2-hydroxychromene-2-carboxylate isomerase
MTAAAEFHFDFGSPNAYLSHRIIPQIEARTGVSVAYVPVLLGGVFKATNNRSPMEAFAGIENKQAFFRRETERFLERHNITNYARNPHFLVNTLLIMRGACVAADEGKLATYVDAVYKCMWEQGLKMDDPAVAANALTDAGFDGPALLARTQEPAIKAALVANTEASVKRGCFGSPTFFAGDEMYFGKDQLRDFEEAILAAKG